uniref:Uncharacterized protein n=1 Tax=Octopus bimaculoides TaxID=37653 RepID=A0A0L8H3H8_OCTBM
MSVIINILETEGNGFFWGFLIHLTSPIRGPKIYIVGWGTIRVTWLIASSESRFQSLTGAYFSKTC